MLEVKQKLMMCNSLVRAAAESCSPVPRHGRIWSCMRMRAPETVGMPARHLELTRCPLPGVAESLTLVRPGHQPHPQALTPSETASAAELGPVRPSSPVSDSVAGTHIRLSLGQLSTGRLVGRDRAVCRENRSLRCPRLRAHLGLQFACILHCALCGHVHGLLLTPPRVGRGETRRRLVLGRRCILSTAALLADVRHVAPAGASAAWTHLQKLWPYAHYSCVVFLTELRRCSTHVC